MIVCRYAIGVAALILAAMTSLGFAADAIFIDDPNDDGLNFDTANVFVNGSYGLDVSAPLAVYNQNFMGPCCSGAGWSISISNGENGITASFDDGAGTPNAVENLDINNEVDPNPVFTTIGNASGKLENGNVLRLSAWLKSDPENPIVLDPQIQPVFKFEFWKEALSANQDTTGGAVQPFFGDKVFDQDSHGAALNIPDVDQPQWVDFNGDGQVVDSSAAAEDRVSSINTEEWTLVETIYTVNDSDWLGIDDDVYTAEDIEEIRGVMFMGDFAGTDLTGDGDGGNLLLDNLLMEVFADAAAVTPNANPVPIDIPEPTAYLLALSGFGVMAGSRRL